MITELATKVLLFIAWCFEMTVLIGIAVGILKITGLG